LSRNNLSGSRTKVLEIDRFNGLNNAVAFQDIDITQSRKMLNGLPGSIGSLKKRSGTVPLTETPLTNPVRSLFSSSYSGGILGVSGSNLYSFDHILNKWTEEVMTVPLSDYWDVDMAEFKDESGQDVVMIVDGGKLKYWDGYDVKEVTPAANDESPLPANDLAKINNNQLKGCLVHNTRLVLWSPGDTLWHSKIGYYDYFPQTDYQRFVREGDGIQTCVSYGGALVVFMREHVAVLFGHDREDWAQDFLDTNNGCLNPKTVRTVTFPDGRQEIFYLSYDGVHAIRTINTLSLDNSARYASRSVTDKKVDWKSLGVERTEWAQDATAYFHEGLYWLIYKKDGQYKGLVFDTMSEQWFPIENVKANVFLGNEHGLLFAGDDGHMRTFDEESWTDWDDKAKTAGTPIDFYWYSKIMTPKLTGHEHFWDILMIEAQQFPVSSTLDVEVNTYSQNFTKAKAVKTAAFVWGVTEWGESEWANEKLTDLLNNAKRLRTFLKGQYAQIKLSNNRNEPIELYNIKYETRPMDTYY
jgi:hypothetical protein